MGKYHLVTFDPGGTTGWAHFILNEKAFSRPEHKVLRYVESWDYGEFTGPEVSQLEEARRLMHRARGWGTFTTNNCHIVSEAFELKQLVGGNNLLSPVRINAVLDWLCQTQLGLQLQTQRRTMRTGVTPERLREFGFEGHWTTTGKGKDAFAAMQHAIVWLRRQKQQSIVRPWKLSGHGHFNDSWDCACEKGKQCDLEHPR